MLVTEGLKMKICDFGISRTVDGTHTTDMTGSIGTIAWSAPEMYSTTCFLKYFIARLAWPSKHIFCGRLSGSSYTSAVDVYAFGILLWEIATQKAPYEGITSVKIISSVIGGLRPMVPMPSGKQHADAHATYMVACEIQHCRPGKPTINAAVSMLQTATRTFPALMS